MEEVWKTKVTWYMWLRASDKGCWPRIGLDRLSFSIRMISVPRNFIGESQCGLMATLAQSVEVNMVWL